MRPNNASFLSNVVALHRCGAVTDRKPMPEYEEKRYEGDPDS
jgi:hypothetical protein